MAGLPLVLCCACHSMLCPAPPDQSLVSAVPSAQVQSMPLTALPTPHALSPSAIPPLVSITHDPACNRIRPAPVHLSLPFVAATPPPPQRHKQAEGTPPWIRGQVRSGGLGGLRTRCSQVSTFLVCRPLPLSVTTTLYAVHNTPTIVYMSSGRVVSCRYGGCSCRQGTAAGLAHGPHVRVLARPAAFPHRHYLVTPLPTSPPPLSSTHFVNVSPPPQDH